MRKIKQLTRKALKKGAKPVKYLLHKNKYLHHISKNAYIAIRKSPDVAKHMIIKARDYPKIRRDTRSYKNALIQNSIKKSAVTETAVVIHLFYTDTWPLFTANLTNIPMPFDLFVSVQAKDSAFAQEIRKKFPNAYVYPAPNRGRDVLPFMIIAKELLKHGYKYVLKIHSKKSKHRTDGKEWMSGMLKSLIPNSESTKAQLRDILSKDTTGIVGPKNQYVSLEVNFPSNRAGVYHVLCRLMSKKKSNKVIKHYKNYGFFAGTMFWVRLDAIKQIIKKWSSIHDFEAEKGQIDATLAHALERSFCILPELTGRKMYTVGDHQVTEIAYKTTYVPDWSKSYRGEKAKT